MAEQKNNFTKDILASIAEATAYIDNKPNAVRAKKYVCADAKIIRERLNMSQSEFSRSYGIPLATLRNWEQKRNHPDRTASAYLWAIEDLPKQISEAQTRHQMLYSNNETEAMASNSVTY